MKNTQNNTHKKTTHTTTYNFKIIIMKNAIKTVKENVVRWLSTDQAALVVLMAVMMLMAWVAGWLMGHIGSGVTMVFENTASSLAMAVVAGVTGAGSHVEGEPLTTSLASEVSPGLLRNEIDDRIVKIHPMSTPLDQISRYGGARLCGSMKVEYYSVDTKPVTATLSAGVSAANGEGATAVIHTTDNAIFQPTTTVMVPGVALADGSSLVLYVISSDSDGVKVMAANNAGIPAIGSGLTLVRMGRAAAELDVMTSQFEALPAKRSNYCQIFKAQVEQSTFMKIANKEVGWSFSDQEEAAIIDMRMGMEKNFLYGCKGRITDPVKGEEVCLTGGIWNQTSNTFQYDPEAEINEEWLVKLCRQAFAHNAGSSRKVLLAGSELIEKLHLCGSQRVVLSDKAVTKWGLDFTEIHSKFGTLYVLLSEVFDQCGHAADGMVIDPEYVVKYCHVPFRTERLNLRSSGVRNVDAIVITEASCLVLRYPESHMRISAA